MQKKGQNTILSIVVVIIIFVAVGLTIAKSTVDTATTTTTIANESVTPTFNAFVSLANNDIVEGSDVVRNASGNTLTRDTHYAINYVTGQINVSTTPAPADNTTYVDYNYYQAGYVKDASSRTIISTMLIIFAVMGLMLISRSLFGG